MQWEQRTTTILTISEALLEMDAPGITAHEHSSSERYCSRAIKHNCSYLLRVKYWKYNRHYSARQNLWLVKMFCLNQGVKSALTFQI